MQKVNAQTSYGKYMDLNIFHMLSMHKNYSVQTYVYIHDLNNTKYHHCASGT